MKVSELPYKRVTIEEIKAVMDDVLARTRNAKSVDEILAAREDYLKLLCDYRTAESLSYMRYSINTVDEFYVAEKFLLAPADYGLDHCHCDVVADQQGQIAFDGMGLRRHRSAYIMSD